MIGRVMWAEFFLNPDWPLASAVALMFLIVLVGPIAVYRHFSDQHSES
jgi:putrescine transport system permease protein